MMYLDIDRAEPGELAAFHRKLAQRPAWRWSGRVLEATEQTVLCEGPLCSVGECCIIAGVDGSMHEAEVIGFRGPHVLTMPLVATTGIRFGDAVHATGRRAQIPAGDALLGRVIDAVGRPLDHRPLPHSLISRSVDQPPTAPLDRLPIRETLTTGIRSIDGMLTVGRGQRIGIFGGSGVGKSTLIGMMTRNTNADLTIVGLVGERGREVGEFLEDSLGDGFSRSTVVVSTSDQSPLLRMRAAMAATALAEYHADQGKHVLLVLDSLTRYAMAAREVGLASGEPPASKGYTPGVFARLARLVERAGRFRNGSITAFYTVLMEGDDQQDPIVDAVRSFLDGHLVLSRRLASQGWYPPIDVLDSLSRLMPAIVSTEHRTQATHIRRLLAAHARSEDLVKIGAYSAGSDRELDEALRAMPAIQRFLEQSSSECCSFADTLAGLDRVLANG